MDQALQAGFLQLAPQVAHIHIQKIGVADERAAPYSLQNLLA